MPQALSLCRWADGSWVGVGGVSMPNKQQPNSEKTKSNPVRSNIGEAGFLLLVYNQGAVVAVG